MKDNTKNPVNEQDDFTAFKEALLCAVRSVLDRRGLPSDLIEQDVLLAGKNYRGVSTAGAGQAGAIANLDRLYESYNGTNLKELAEEAVATLTRETDIAETVDWITNYEQVRPRLFARLVNAERNKELLRSAPHRMVADLPVVYCAIVRAGNDMAAQITITDAFLKEYGITEKQLYRDAIEAMTVRKDWQVAGLAEMMGHPGSVSPAMVVTGNRPNGASNILLPEVQERLTEFFGDRFMILPSSIHELICVPYSETGAKELRELVRRVNRTVVEPEDVMSDNVYVFEKGEIRVFRN